jgi:hypothetical protein
LPNGVQVHSAAGDNMVVLTASWAGKKGEVTVSSGAVVYASWETLGTLIIHPFKGDSPVVILDISGREPTIREIPLGLGGEPGRWHLIPQATLKGMLRAYQHKQGEGSDLRGWSRRVVINMRNPEHFVATEWQQPDFDN